LSSTPTLEPLIQSRRTASGELAYLSQVLSLIVIILVAVSSAVNFVPVGLYCAPRTATNQLLYGQHFIQANFTGIHILKKGDRIGNLIMLAAKGRGCIQVQVSAGIQIYKKTLGSFCILSRQLLHYSSQRHDFLTQL